MAGQYRQTYKQKPTTKLAPDAVVLIRGEPVVTICPSCDGQVILSDHINTITTTLSTNGTVGTASFTIAAPKHGHDGNYFVRGGRVFGVALMDEVEIYIKARFPHSEGDGVNYQYRKVFWGLIVNVQESYSDGFQNISVGCESILKWLQIMQTNERPAAVFSSIVKSSVNLGAAATYGKTYANENPYEVILQMLTVTYYNMVAPASLDVGKPVGTEGTDSALRPNSLLGRKDEDLMEYWGERFSKLKTNLKMFGVSPSDYLGFKEIGKTEGANQEPDGRSIVAKNANTPLRVNYDSKALMDFKPFQKLEEGKKLDVMSNSYKNNLEIINEIKLITGYEFFLDTNGDIVFKPPFWNLDTSKNTVYTFKDTDIISWDFSEDANQVVSRVHVTGSLSFALPSSAEVTPKATFTDYRLARQYGITERQVPNRYLTNAKLCYYHAISELDRINANRYRATLTIVGRPELQLGMPVYIESRDIFGYIDSISHNFAFGGQFTTNVELSAVRRKYLGDSTLASEFKFIGKSTQSVGFVGQPTILINTGNLTTETLINKIKREQGDQKARDSVANERTFTSEEQQIEFDEVRLYQSNLGGKYEEFLLNSKEAKAVLSQAQDAKNRDDQDAYLNFLEVAIPISDEAGYELIGIFENGRILELTEDNILRKKGGNFDEILSNNLRNSQKNKNIKGVKPKADQIAPEVKSGTISTDTGNADNNSSSGNPFIVSTFTKVKSTNLRDLSPASKDIKTCSCYDAALTTNLPSELKYPLKTLIKNIRKQNGRNETSSQ
ncbi:hypothetical protein N9948_01395 [bacterium]|nr:hypothetical protein [bacterium]